MSIHKYTLPDSGIEVRIRKVSPMLFIRLRERYASKEPKPPLNEVVTPDGRKIYEPNASDPDFQEALIKHEAAVQEASTRLMMIYGVVCDQVNMDEVNNLREFWLNEYGEELKGTDHELYVQYIAIASDKDLAFVMEKVMSRSFVDEEKVDAAKRIIKSDVQGS